MSPSPTLGVAKYVTVTGVFSRMRGNVEGETSAAIHGEEGWQGEGGCLESESGRLNRTGNAARDLDDMPNSIAEMLGFLRNRCF